MTVFKRTKAQAMQRQAAVGLAAIGSSGPWQIALDESTSGPEGWYLQVEGPTICFRFQIPSPDIIHSAMEYLLGSGDPAGLVLSQTKQSSLTLIRDDEPGQRYFFVGETASGSLRITVAGQDLDHVIAALRQVKDDLSDDGAIA